MIDRWLVDATGLAKPTPLRQVFVLAIAAVLIVASQTAVLADGVKNTDSVWAKNPWIVGLTYPGVTAGYQGRSFGVELRGYSNNDVVLFGPRFTHYPFTFENSRLYWGTDAFYVNEFDGELTEGSGYMAGAIFGFQQYLGAGFSLTFDSGPYYIELEDNLSGLKVDGLEFVVNSSVNFHF